MVSTNALARVMVVQMLWRSLVAAVGFVLLAAAVSGCGNTPLPAALAPKSCPGDPCGVMACPSGFICSVDAQCGAHCEPQPLPHRLF